MPNYTTLDQIQLNGRRAVVRVDLNVPLRDGVVTDTTRIERIMPTLNALTQGGASVVLLSHLGRPKGKVLDEASLKPIAGEVAKLLGKPVSFIATDWRDDEAASAAQDLNAGEIALAENLRFHPGEEANDPDFAKKLGSLGDLYVNDAFSAAHRAHASTQGITEHLPACAGLSMAAELNALETALTSPVHPVVAIVGGSKVSTKIAVLENLVVTVDHLVIGGGMANTFLAADGVNVQASLCEHDLIDTVKTIQSAAANNDCEIVLPIDAVVASELRDGAPAETCAIDAVGEGQMILDVGPQTTQKVNDCLVAAKTLLWNGPLGAFEFRPFDVSTMSIAHHAAALTSQGKLVSVAGGGDTVAALNTAKVTNDFTYVSTAGGAFLEWLEGKELPGVAALAIKN